VHGDALLPNFFRKRIDYVFNWKTDRKKLDRLINNADFVIVDSYLASPGFYKNIAGLPVVPVYLDDCRRISYPHGVIVNGGIGAERLRYPGSARFPRLAGAKYALVRKEFWKVKPPKINRTVRNVLVTFGGIKRGDFLPAFLRQIVEAMPDLLFHIVLSAENRALVKRNKLDHFQNLKFHFCLAPDRMRDLMWRCDLAISGGGQTTNELARCGLPTLGICFANNQKLNLNGWQRSGFLRLLGGWKDKRLVQRLAKMMAGLDYRKRLSMSRSGRALVDGRGPERVAQALKVLSFRFVPAQNNDSRRFFLWSNDPETRAMSFQTASIQWPEHQKWFAAKLKERGLLFWMACLGNEKIGSARFLKVHGKVTSSFVIAPKQRGKGLGARLVRTAKRIAMEQLKVDRIDAFIKNENIVSKKIFRKAGYEFRGNVRVKEHRAEHWVMRKT
jgi:spore coat polysaccharide biosynthesis predicted glycosyltransferase SpsG/GNAT superfamily N-acetyltransferase